MNYRLFSIEKEWLKGIIIGGAKVLNLSDFKICNFYCIIRSTFYNTPSYFKMKQIRLLPPSEKLF